MGRVGVIGSGQGMTSYDSQKIKYHQTFKQQQPSIDKEVESLSTLGKR